jgi:hypothetical protein
MTNDKLLKIDRDNFKAEKILFNSEKFAIAYGSFRDEGGYIGMRWTHTKKGYPFSSKGEPQWFMLERELDTAILLSLIGKKGAEEEDVIKLYKSLLPKKGIK